MEQEYEEPEEWTAWKVWLHPRVARDALDESVLTVMNLRKELGETAMTLEEQQEMCKKLSEERDNLLRQLSLREEELDKTRREAEDFKTRLEEALEDLEDSDARLLECDRALRKVEDMKKGYEKRIAYLSGLIKKRNARYAEDDELALDEDILSENRMIDMTAPAKPSESGQPEKETEDQSDKDISRDSTADIDKYGQKINGDAESVKKSGINAEDGKNWAADLRRRFNEKIAPGLPEDFKEQGSSDEWLLDLPDNL